MEKELGGKFMMEVAEEEYHFAVDEENLLVVWHILQFEREEEEP